jgi:hypothetical protein
MGYNVTAADEPNSGVSETALLEEEALTDSASYDRLMSRGNLTAIPASVARHQTDWEGLTVEEEAVARKRKDQEVREEYERVMEQVRERADQLMRRLDEQEHEVHKHIAEADARAIMLRDGRRVLVGKNGDYIEEETGTKLEGSDAADAQSRRTATSETEEEHNNLKKQLDQIEEAREHARNAGDLASENGKTLSADQRKENAAQAQAELAVAEAATQKIAYVDAGANDDMAAALGLAGDKGGPLPGFASISAAD